MTDPADLESLCQSVNTHAAVLNKHDDLLHDILAKLGEMNAVITEMRGALAAPPPPAAPVTSQARYAMPERFDGRQGCCRSFVLQCELNFAQLPGIYTTDISRVSFMIGLLRGAAMEWASALWEKGDPITTSYPAFVAELKRMFYHPVRGPDASKRLLSLSQGTSTVLEYAITFRTLAAECGWNNASLTAAFSKGLSEAIKDELVSHPETTHLEECIKLAIRVDNRMTERRREKELSLSLASASRNAPSTSRNALSLPVPTAQPRPLPLWSSPPEGEPGHEPMQLGRLHISQEERRRRRDANCCLYCGEQGHLLAACPVRPSNRQARQGRGGP